MVSALLIEVSHLAFSPDFSDGSHSFSSITLSELSPSTYLCELSRWSPPLNYNAFQSETTILSPNELPSTTSLAEVEMAGDWCESMGVAVGQGRVGEW